MPTSASFDAARTDGHDTAPPAGGQGRPLAVFADDWGRHPSSCQHLVRHLLPTREVLWVNTIGTRPPRLDWSTAKRVAGKLRSWSRTAPPAPANIEAAPRILSPKMWPSFASRRSRRLNRSLLERALRPAFEALPEPPVVLTTLPLVADLVGRLPAARWVYYCVDDFAQWPGYDGATLQQLERELVPKVDVLVAVSEHLQGHLKRLGRDSHLLTHGVDLERWRVAGEPGGVPEFAGLEPPLVLFWGVIDRRLDLDFVRKLSESLTAGTLVFVGPREDPDPALAALPRVALRPAVPFARLPALAAAAQVLIMPYADAPVTRAMQPLKMKEYLATGRPCVMRDLPSTRLWADALDVAASPDGFAAKVLERLAGGPPASQAGPRRRLEAEGWGAKAQELAGWLDGDGVLPPLRFGEGEQELPPRGPPPTLTPFPFAAVGAGSSFSASADGRCCVGPAHGFPCVPATAVPAPLSTTYDSAAFEAGSTSPVAVLKCGGVVRRRRRREPPVSQVRW